MFWDKVYGDNGHIWGTEPSELAFAAVEYLHMYKQDNQPVNIVDIGCGYGRDTFYLAESLQCTVLGIDRSEKAIEIASEMLSDANHGKVAFRKCDFTDLDYEEYDIVFASHLYHLLNSEERKKLRRTITRLMKPKGLLFLSTLSVKDPEHYGKGNLVPGEINSFFDKTYLHLCTKDELLDDFGFLYVKEMYEHEFREPRATGETHHHISWIMAGENMGEPIGSE
jgi:ubiquinone/menaquinone biosynthesis C-methylase UbiE